MPTTNHPHPHHHPRRRIYVLLAVVFLSVFMWLNAWREIQSSYTDYGSTTSSTTVLSTLRSKLFTNATYDNTKTNTNTSNIIRSDKSNNDTKSGGKTDANFGNNVDIHATPQQQKYQDQNNNTNYLLYYAHSGFTNQMLELERAAYLALATNRTLVLAPIIPHLTIYHGNLTYPEFHYRTHGGGCRRTCSFNQKYDVQVSHVRDDFKKAGGAEVKFPSFTALFDFRELMRSTGVGVIDMTEFADLVRRLENEETSSSSSSSSSLLSTNMWCTGTNLTGDMLAGQGTTGTGTTFAEVVHHIQQACTLAHRVAAVGSVFYMNKPDPDDGYFGKGVEDGFSKFFDSLPLTKEMTILLRELYSQLPHGYVGVHTRFRDRNNKINAMECDDPSVKNVYDQVLNGLSEQNTTNNTHILIGNSKTGTLECMEHYARGRYSVSTINSIVDRNSTFLGIIGNMQVDKSAVYILLDMVLIGIADKVVFALERGFPSSKGSTFQERIKSLHSYRNVILDRIYSLNIVR